MNSWNRPARTSTVQAFTPRVLPHPYAFNLFNHNTAD
jgi:hypothetical protein